jgi:hypothetical protein
MSPLRASWSSSFIGPFTSAVIFVATRLATSPCSTHAAREQHDPVAIELQAEMAREQHAKEHREHLADVRREEIPEKLADVVEDRSPNVKVQAAASKSVRLPPPDPHGHRARLEVV